MITNENMFMNLLVSLIGISQANGQSARFLSPERIVKFHSGYTLDESDYRGVKALCLRFNIQLPDEYVGVEKKNGSLPDDFAR